MFQEYQEKDLKAPPITIYNWFHAHCTRDVQYHFSSLEKTLPKNLKNEHLKTIFFPFISLSFPSKTKKFSPISSAKMIFLFYFYLFYFPPFFSVRFILPPPLPIWGINRFKKGVGNEMYVFFFFINSYSTHYLFRFFLHIS